MALVLSPLASDEPPASNTSRRRTAHRHSINDLLKRSKGKGERLYFFYAGHGLTARVSNRDENALVADRLHAC